MEEQSHALAFAPDGKRLAVYYRSGHLICCTVRGDTPWKTQVEQSAFAPLRYSADGKLLALGTEDGDRPHIFDASSGAAIAPK